MSSDSDSDQPRSVGELTAEQRATLNGLRPRGLMLNVGSPCECGPEGYVTTSEPRYSDTMVYHHRCGECRQIFSTWTEG